jgi:aminoglycoside phosphotransferase (APT) family kinase protein
MSLTKVDLSEAEIEALARNAFGTGVRLISARPADEGMYNAAYYLELSGAGPARAFLKAAPPPGLPVLTYEHELLRSEIRVLGELAAAGVEPVPAVLASDLTRRIVDRDCLFMAWLDGALLSKVGPSLSLDERVGLRRQVGRIAGAANAITAPVFGYPGQPSLRGARWTATFALMVEALLDDARRFGAALPLDLGELRAAFACAQPLTDRVETARLTHFDLWDGNVLVRQGPSGWEVSGVIDWERAFYGDPLADVVSMTLFHNPPERAAVLEGLAEGWGRPAGLGEDEERLLHLYKAYLWLIMIVEATPRGFGGSILLPGSRAAQRLTRDLSLAAA